MADTSKIPARRIEGFEEIANFDKTIDEINEKLESKADKSTSLSGYNIEDAYTKEEVDTKFAEINVDDSNFVHLDNDEIITGNKTFTGQVLVPTVELTSNDNSAVSTAFINSKFKIVDTLPENPDPNTFYFIKE